MLQVSQDMSLVTSWYDAVDHVYSIRFYLIVS